MAQGPLGRLAGAISVSVGGIRPTEILDSVEEQDGILRLMMDAAMIGQAMPNTGNGTVTDEVEDQYRRYNIPHGPNWTKSFANTD